MIFYRSRNGDSTFNTPRISNTMGPLTPGQMSNYSSNWNQSSRNSTFKKSSFKKYAPKIGSQRGDNHLIATSVEDYNDPHKYAIKF